MPNRSRTVVLDAGHGGTEAAGGSSPNHATGPNGLLEKDLTLDMARRVKRLLGETDVVLTRDNEGNLTLTERAATAKRHDARLFLSLHWNGTSDPAKDGTEAWVARRANPLSRRFARILVDRLARLTGAPNRGVRERDMGVLLPERHDPETGACLLEVAFLSNPNEARRLEHESYRDELARGLADSIREGLQDPPASGAALEMGEGPPLLSRATTDCWARCRQLLHDATRSTNPNQIAGARLNVETGIRVDANPYAGLNEAKINAVIRAAYQSQQMPEVLLALWAKEGSTRMETAARAIPQVSTEANARTIFRSQVYYVALGTDHFLDTTRPPGGGDNVWDESDAAATRHENRFTTEVRALVTARVLPEDISAAINAELTVRRVSGQFTVQPSVRFYALSLLLADAYFTQLQNMSYPQLTSIPTGLNYIHWNMGEAAFRTFLASADTHRREPAHQVNGQPVSIEQWALHSRPAATEYLQPRTNAIKFLHYMESYRPIFANSITLIKPGIEDLQTSRSRTAGVEALSNDLLIYAGGRTYTPSADASLFQHAPDPVAVTSAALLPNPSTTADADIRTALAARGCTTSEIAGFERNGGLAPLRPVAEALGEAALAALLERMRYTKAQLLNPPHSHGRQLTAHLSVRNAAEILVPRVLLAIPGHFRELARHASDEAEAFALENAGWLLMTSLRDAVATATNKRWWLPAAPAFVTRFSSTLPPLTSSVEQVIRHAGLIDPGVTAAAYNTSMTAWRTGLAGRHWRLETGVDTSGPGVGRPFYVQLVTVPPSVNIAAQKHQIDLLWAQRLRETDARLPPNSAESTLALTDCPSAEEARVERTGLLANGSLGGLEIVYGFPLLDTARPRTHMKVLAAIQPAFEGICATLHDLGWNDLLCSTAGTLCFRGKKIAGSAGAARQASNHSYATAIDIMAFENPPGNRHATIDPRIVAVFEAFRYRWGRAFPTPDPHHFEYNG